MLVPLSRSQDRVEIYLRGKPLGTLIEAGQLRLTDERGSSILTPNEIGLRFNNWDRVRAEHLPVSLSSAAACGAIMVVFILVAAGRLTYRDDQVHPRSQG
jgi:predicted xylose isomerase-like sugar epimerase